MKRLTKYLASGAADYNYPADCYGGNDCNDRAAKSAYRQTCVERLAAYEDTGLTPEEVLPKDKADEIALKLMRLADLESFLAFKKWADENGYKEGLTIDRVDNNGDYCPENCRWVDRKTQANNLEVTVKIKVIDTEKTLHEWADFLGINPYTLYDRLRAGWPPERALFERVSLNKYEHQKKALEAMKDE